VQASQTWFSWLLSINCAVTCPGECRTGGNTPQHGIAGNEWFDSETRQAVYNTEDERHPQIGHGKVDRRVAPRDVAPTISAYLGISPPSGAVGNPLPAIGETSSRP